MIERIESIWTGHRNLVVAIGAIAIVAVVGTGLLISLAPGRSSPESSPSPSASPSLIASDSSTPSATAAPRLRSKPVLRLCPAAGRTPIWTEWQLRAISPIACRSP